MKCETIISNCESEFRKYVIQHYTTVQRIIIFEDILDHTVFFYCFLKNNLFIATKEKSYMDFTFFYKIYERLAEELGFYTIFNNIKTPMIELNKNKHF